MTKTIGRATCNSTKIIFVPNNIFIYIIATYAILINNRSNDTEFNFSNNISDLSIVN